MQLERSVVLPLRLADEHAAIITFEFTRVFESGLHLLPSPVQPHLDGRQRQLEQFRSLFRREAIGVT